MTPAARVQSAIELVQQIEAGPTPADRLVADYFRHRRYAGAKDRRAIRERLYGVLRARGMLAWRLTKVEAPVDARRLVLAGLAATDGLGVGELDRLCDGAKYAPSPLTETERAWLTTLQAAPMPDAPLPPDWARGNYPDWLDDAVKSRFGADWPTEMAAFGDRAPLDLRANTLKTTRAAVLEALDADGIAAEPCPFSPVGVRLNDPVRITDHRLYKTGRVEVQDEGAQAVALLAAAQPGMQVIDLCAGAGGKSLVLAARMANSGQIHAFDIDRRRLSQLAVRMQRAGVRNLQARLIAGIADPWLERLDGKADLVLVDAPCSGSGTWRRHPEQGWRLTRAGLDRYCGRQRELLARAAGLVAPGGRLVYATCSFLGQENEAQADTFVAANPSFSVLPAAPNWHGNLTGAYPSKGPYLMLSPARHATDAYFAATFERRVC